MRPPGVKECWDDNNVWSQAVMIAYSQIRDYERQEELQLVAAGRLT